MIISSYRLMSLPSILLRGDFSFVILCTTNSCFVLFWKYITRLHDKNLTRVFSYNKDAAISLMLGYAIPDGEILGINLLLICLFAIDFARIVWWVDGENLFPCFITFPEIESPSRPQPHAFVMSDIRMFAWKRKMMRTIKLKFLLDDTIGSSRNFTDEYCF